MNAFEALGLNEQIVKSITDLGFETPTSIQEKAIPVLLSGTTDFIGLAQTGTGKTAAFGLPLLQLIDPSQRHPQALIVCPTRELCLQITNDLETYKKHSKNIFTEAVYGGASIMMQIRNLKKGVHIVIATPGRLIDMIERKVVDLQKVKYVVLDEADEMLNMGFRDDIDFVLKNTVNRESIWLFSATMPAEVRSIAKNFMESPKADAQTITEKLIKENYEIEALHGDLTQQQRDKVMARFRQKSIQLLIATDVAARGIDVEGISHVINFELPDDMEVYTHRSGRTGRAGKSGISISIVTPKEIYRLKQIEKMVNTRLHKMDIPSGKDV